MPFWNRKPAPAAPLPNRTIEITTWAERSCGDFHLAVRGEATYIEAIRTILASSERRKGDPFGVSRFGLVPEQTNPYDDHAVRVVAVDDFATVGYLSRFTARQLQPRLVLLAAD